MKKLLIPGLILVFLGLLVIRLHPQEKPVAPGSTPLQTTSGQATPTPTPKPLTFAEMNQLYGPCVKLPVLMYHHVQEKKKAMEKGQINLTVETAVFKEQMNYLKSKGYQTVGVSNLINFFDLGGGIPAKSILITFDDGYSDFYSDALPILKENGFQAVVFLPTGLMENPGYLTWGQIAEAAGSGIYFANHTWSHKNVQNKKEIAESEISTADFQLTEKGLNSLKVFSYPYGLASSYDEIYLGKLGYKLAFTTKAGNTLCKALRLELPRVRIGNTPISVYGF